MGEYDDDILDEQEYTKGFNKGYIIAQYEPDLGKELAWNTKHQDSFTSGLIFGAHELFKEQELNRQEELGQIRGQAATKEKPQTKDTDHEETGDWEKDKENNRLNELNDLREKDQERGDIERDA